MLHIYIFLSSRKFYSLLPIYPSLSFALVYTLRNTSYLCALLLVSTLHIFPVILLSEKMVSYLSLFLLHSEKAMAPHFSTLAWKLPWTEEPGRLQSMGSLRVGHDWVTSLSLFTFMHWKRKWQPTTVFLPGESQGRGSLVGCHVWPQKNDFVSIKDVKQPPEIFFWILLLIFRAVVSSESFGVSFRVLKCYS